jgi:HEAT repeat protein
LVEAVRDDEGYLVADAALRALGQLGPAAASATDDLILMDRGGKPPLNPDLLAETLVKMGPVTIPRLVFHLRLSASPGDEEAFGSGGLAERVLAQLGRDAVRPLIQVLQDPDRRDGAARALANLGPTAIDAAPALMELYEEEGAPKIIIIQAIYNMGKDACVARQFLGRLAASKAPEVQGYVRAEVEDALRNLQGCPGR